jgi:hypothetical protein
MDFYQSQAFEQIAYFYVIPIISSIIYFSFSKNKILKMKLLISSHGFILVLASLFAVFISSSTTTQSFKIEYYSFCVLLVLAVISILYTLKNYEGKNIIHLFQIVNLLSVFVFWFIGGMTISHDWL